MTFKEILSFVVEFILRALAIAVAIFVLGLGLFPFTVEFLRAFE